MTDQPMVTQSVGAPHVDLEAERGPVQVLPEASSEERMHVRDETCWCKPTVETFGDTLVHGG